MYYRMTHKLNQHEGEVSVDFTDLVKRWNDFSDIVGEKDRRKKIIQTLIRNFENNSFDKGIEHINKIFNSISSDTRIKILFILSQIEAFHYELEFILGLSQPTISHHVSKLIDVNLVARDKKDRLVFLSLTDLGKTFILYFKELLQKHSDILLF